MIYIYNIAEKFGYLLRKTYITWLIAALLIAPVIIIYLIIVETFEGFYYTLIDYCREAYNDIWKYIPYKKYKKYIKEDGNE